ncbi:MAG: hypothetical protein EBZ48_13320 [Proteobacteria bacterium]|nr:hypothetical protein [Pseudomonadota bacterium]
MTDSSPQSATPPRIDREHDVPLRVLLSGLGVLGPLFFVGLILGGAAILLHLQEYALSVLLPYTEETRADNFKDTLALVVRSITWLPMLPILLVAVFLPVRLAWVHGRVRCGDLLENTRDAFTRCIHTLQYTWRQILFLLIPLLGIVVLLHELQQANQPQQLLIFMQLAAAGFGAAALWQITAVICAAPIAILAQSEPLSASQHAQAAIRGKRRVEILSGLLLLIGLVLAVHYLVTSNTFSYWRAGAVYASALIPGWIVLIAIARSCLLGTVRYLEKLQQIEQQAVASHAVQMNLNGMTTTLPNGQPVTIHIEHLHVDPRR